MTALNHGLFLPLLAFSKTTLLISLTPSSDKQLMKFLAIPALARYRMRLVIAVMVSTWLSVSWIVSVVERDVPNATITTYGKALWWGIVTFTTVGYGDYAPITAVGRVLAVVMMFAGVISIGIITAKISTYFIEQILMEGRGAVDKTKIKDHFVICGWKEDMPDLVKHVLLLNPTLKTSNLVIVANKTQEQIATFKSEQNLSAINFIIGEHFHQATLQRAAPESARKVLIIADTSPGPDGRKPNATEADARTIMAAIALSNISKGTMVAAEILDPNLDSYLKMAGVGEIVYSRECNRLLLGSASGSTGMANVFHDLIDPRSGAHLGTRDIPERFEGKTYAEFRSDFENQHTNMLLLGILENTGNPHSIKEMAFKEAQRTPSVGLLIENLKSVKTLRCNNPVFHPRSDFRIAKGSAAIVLTPEVRNAKTEDLAA